MRKLMRFWIGRVFRILDLTIIRTIYGRHDRKMAFEGDESMILFLDTEFTDISPEMVLLSVAMVSADGRHEFYGERNDVPLRICSRFVREAVLPLMTAQPPISGDFANLRTRLRAFIEGLPEQGQLACDSFYDIDLLTWVIGEPWPKKLAPNRLDLNQWTSIPVFANAQALYHESGHPYHHALNDVHGLRAGYLAWLKNAS